MSFKNLLVAAFVIALTGGVYGQDPDYVGTVSDGIVIAGGSGDLTISMDNNGADIAGWSYGVCNETAFLECTDAVDGSTTATVNNGGAPDFNQISVSLEGFTVGVVICFTGCAVLGPGTGYELNVATYSGIAEGSTEVAFCNTLGSPAVDVVVVVGGASIPFTQNSGAVDVLGVPDPALTFHAGSASSGYNPADGNATVTVEMSISETDNSDLGAPFPNDTQGFSMGLGNGPEVTTTAVNLDLPFSADFAESSIYDEGWTVGVVYSFTGGNVLQFPEQATVLTVDYDTAGSMAGNDTGTTSALSWIDTLGSPPVANVAVIDGGSFTPEVENGSIELFPVVTIDYLRGDANSDDKVNIADGIWIISELFLSGPVSTCSIASDANNDSLHDAADAIYIFAYRFSDGPPPASPFPACGQVAGQTPEDCAASGCSGGGPAPATNFVDDIQPILAAACAPCHTPEGGQFGPSAGLILTEDAYGNVANVPSGQCGEMNLITPGDRQMSWLYRKVEGSHTAQDVLDMGCCPDDDGDGEPDGCGRQMPRFCGSEDNPCLDAATIELIGSWIDSGAP